MKKVLAQSKKELAQFARDKLTVALAFVLPLLSLMLFGFGIRLEIKDIALVVQNFDQGMASVDLVDRIYNNAQFKPHKWDGPHPIESAIDKGYAKAAVIIPPDFSRNLRSGETAHFQVFVDATDVNNARVIKNGIIGTTNGYVQANRLNEKYRTIIDPDIRLWFNPGRKESLYVVPGALGLCLWIYPSLLAALAMVREKESGTILQVYASSITAKEFIGGKVLAYLLVGISECLVLLFASVLCFDIAFIGDPTPFIIGTLFFILSSVCFGTLIGTRTASQSSAVQAVATGGFATALLLSGYLYPVRNIVWPLSLITIFVPNRWFVQLARDTFARGADWAYDWYLPIFLLIGALFFFLIASKNLSKMQLEI